MVPLPFLRSPCQTADALRIMVPPLIARGAPRSVVGRLVLRPQRLFDDVAVEATSGEQRVQAPPSYRRIEGSVTPPGLGRHPARQPHLVGRPLLLFEARESQLDVLAPDAPPAQV